MTRWPLNIVSLPRPSFELYESIGGCPRKPFVDSGLYPLSPLTMDSCDGEAFTKGFAVVELDVACLSIEFEILEGVWIVPKGFDVVDGG